MAGIKGLEWVDKVVAQRGYDGILNRTLDFLAIEKDRIHHR